jgi:signal peptidase II
MDVRQFTMAGQSIFSKPTRRILALALVIFALDQFTKWIVLHTIYEGDEITVIPGFFNFAHRANTGAAFSQFTGNNTMLAVIALAALVALFLARHHFHARTLTGQLALGLVFGGILGNLTDRLLPGRHAVVDFLHFYLQRRGSGEPLDFPAFNVADSAICAGVALIFLINWRNDGAPNPAAN